jgi:NAD(P) transhydrogenase
VVGALTAAFFGKRVALVEQCRELGGAGINTGTIPSKTLRETALALSGLKARNLYGVDLSLRREASVTDFMYHEQKVTANERDRAVRTLQRWKVEIHHGTARFADPHTVSVTGDGSQAEPTHLRGEIILIATGSSPMRPPEFPFDDPRVHDSNEILELKRLPTSLAVIGAGVIGSEYACTFNALGAKVHIVDGRDVLLPFLDAEVSRVLTMAMQNRGITFHWKERVTRCDAPPTGDVVLTLSSGKTLSVDNIFVAAGRTSNAGELNLAAAGIEPGERGLIKVDARYRTAVAHIYAAGDVIGFPALASTSMAQARIGMGHAFDLGFRCDMAPLLPTGIYTIPEASAVGETEEGLKKKGVDYVVGRVSYRENARGDIMGDELGFLKLLYAREDMKLLGVHVVGEQATELVHIGLMAMLHGASGELFDRTCFNFPTLGSLYQIATYRAMLKNRATQ